MVNDFARHKGSHTARRQREDFRNRWNKTGGTFAAGCRHQDKPRGALRALCVKKKATPARLFLMFFLSSRFSAISYRHS